jgi:hypothetical protein
LLRADMSPQHLAEQGGSRAVSTGWLVRTQYRPPARSLVAAVSHLCHSFRRSAFRTLTAQGIAPLVKQRVYRSLFLDCVGLSKVEVEGSCRSWPTVLVHLTCNAAYRS